VRFARRSRCLVCARFHLDETVGEFGKLADPGDLAGAELQIAVGGESAESMVSSSGESIPADMIVVGIGVACPLEWAQAGGINVNRGILADEYLHTNLPDVWVAGDAAEFQDVILDERVQLGNWVNAQMQGRTAGLNMTGKKEPFKLVSFYTTQGFGITIAFVGDVRPGPDRKIIPRGADASGSYGRVIIKDGEVVGATLINRTQELALLSKIIEKDIKVADHEGDIANAEFNLNDLINAG